MKIVLFFFALMVVGMAQPSQELDSPYATKVSRDFSRWCQVGGQRFIFEKTTLGDIVRSLGAASMTRDGSPGAVVYEWFIRYRWNDEIVTFASNNDMGGDFHDLEEVDIRPAEKSPEEGKLQVIHGEISFPFGAPGMSFRDLRHHLGNASLVNHHLDYEYLGHMPGSDSDGKAIRLDVSGSLRAKIKLEKVDELEVSHVTSD